jgi:hypothetical protein
MTLIGEGIEIFSAIRLTVPHAAGADITVMTFETVLPVEISFVFHIFSKPLLTFGL